MDVVLRAMVAFALIWVVMRVGGKREVAELTVFDMVLLVVIGDLVSQGILQEDYSVTAMTLSVLVFSLAGLALGFAATRSSRARAVLTGEPRIVVRDGEILTDVLKVEGVSVADLHEAARADGIEDMADIRVAVLEVDGDISFITR